MAHGLDAWLTNDIFRFTYDDRLHLEYCWNVGYFGSKFTQQGFQRDSNENRLKRRFLKTVISASYNSDRFNRDSYKPTPGKIRFRLSLISIARFRWRFGFKLSIISFLYNRCGFFILLGGRRWCWRRYAKVGFKIYSGKLFLLMIFRNIFWNLPKCR